MRAFALTLSLLSLTTAACEDSSSGDDVDQLDFRPFDEALQNALDEKKIAGASVAVVHEKFGVMHTQGFGEFAADRLYLIASSSKILSVGVLMRLADQGKLDIDEPIGTYLKDWGETKASKINVAQLVSNSSGLPSLSEVSAAASDSSSPYYSNLCQYTDRGSLSDCGKLLYATEPPREPDTMFAYGGSQWQLAGAVAEQVSGKSWAELIDETYRTPCAVPSLGYTNQFGKAATGYPAFFQGKKANLPVTDNPSIEGGAFVTVGDYAKLLLMHLRGGVCGDTRVLSKEATERMQQDRVADHGGTGNASAPGYGLGFWISPENHTVTDPGAYGSFPLLDQQRRYGVFIAIELTSDVGTQLGAAVKPTLDKIFDDANLDGR